MKLIAQALMVERKNLNDNPTSTTFWTERKKKKSLVAISFTINQLPVPV